MTSDLSIAGLLQAAEYLERREAERSYASSLPTTIAPDYLVSPYTKQNSAALATKYNNHQFSPDAEFHCHHHNYTTITSNQQQQILLHLDDSQILKLNQTTTNGSTSSIMSKSGVNDNHKLIGSRQIMAKQHQHHLSSRVSFSSCGSGSNQSGNDLQTTSASSSGGSCPTANGYLDFSSNSNMNFNQLRECNSSSAINLNPHQSHLLLATNHPDYHLLIQQRSHQIMTDQYGSMSLHNGMGSSQASGSSERSKKKPQGNRTSHSELEKNRRAHLRNCLECLKEVVPFESDSPRRTTFGLLTKAKGFIKTLEELDKEQQMQIDDLLARQKYLRSRLEQASGISMAVTGVAATITALNVKPQVGHQSADEKYHLGDHQSQLSSSFESQPSVMSSADSNTSGPSTSSPAPFSASSDHDQSSLTSRRSKMQQPQQQDQHCVFQLDYDVDDDVMNARRMDEVESSLALAQLERQEQTQQNLVISPIMKANAVKLEQETKTPEVHMIVDGDAAVASYSEQVSQDVLTRKN